jgi:ParB family chromosome partitioning protein
MPKRALGRGLEALIPLREEGFEKEVPVKTISPNKYQPREQFNPEKLKELTASIKEKGIVQPILVRVKGRGYELIAGERRLRAARKLGLKKIPVVIKDVPDEEMLELSLIENIQREDLNPIEEARAYRRLIKEFGLTQSSLAKKVGKERPSIANTLRLLGLPGEIQLDVSRGTISSGHARALLGLGKARQAEVNKRIKRRGLSVREAEELVSRLKRKRPPSTPKKRVRKDAQILALEEELMKTLGTKVRITQRRGKGKIEIEYYSPEDLERILELLGA